MDKEKTNFTKLVKEHYKLSDTMFQMLFKHPPFHISQWFDIVKKLEFKLNEIDVYLVKNQLPTLKDFKKRLQK